MKDLSLGRVALFCLALLPGLPVWAEALLEVRLRPSDSALRANIEAYVGNLGERDPAALQRFARSAEQQAQQALQALGYYRAQVVSQVDEHQGRPRLRLLVCQGEPVRLQQVTIEVLGEAASLAAFRRPRSSRLQPGQVLDHGAYEAAKKLLASQAQRYGFFQGRFIEQRLRVDPQAGTADIHLRYTSGPRHRFGAVSFQGDFAIDERLLQRLQPFAVGDAYDADLVARFAQNLRDSGYFAEVRVDALAEQRSGLVVPVQVNLQQVLPRSFTLGLGYSTDIGPRSRASWTRHWLNPQGHSLGADAELALERQAVGSWYQIPLQQALTDHLRFTAGYQQEQMIDIDTRRYRLGAEWQAMLAGDWQRNLSLNWQEERYDYGQGSPDGRSQLLLAGLGFNHLHSDSPINPSQGYRLQIDSQMAKRGLLADTDLLQVNAQAKGLYSFAAGHRLLARVQAGGIATNDYAAVPPSLRFFAGGDQSVRGYDYQSLSPEDRRGNKVGARYLLAGSLEYQYPLREQWRLATFVDRGNAFDSLSARHFTGIGLGLRWLSPVGPLRLDLAHALDEPGGVRLHFSMGPEL